MRIRRLPDDDQDLALPGTLQPMCSAPNYASKRPQVPRHKQRRRTQQNNEHAGKDAQDQGKHRLNGALGSYFLGLLAAHIMSLETAVRRLTFEFAVSFGLHDRGLLQPGMVADIVIFDPDTVKPLPHEVVTIFRTARCGSANRHRAST